MRTVNTMKLELIQSKNYEKNIDIYGDNSNSCIICGKQIKEVSKYVHLLTTGEIVSSDENFQDSQGYFPIGNNCASKIHMRGFIFN
jgi:hypothetical protein